MELWGGACGLSSHLDKSSIFEINLIESHSLLCHLHWNLSSFFHDSGDEADLPLLQSIIPEQPSVFCYEPAAQKAHA